MLTSWDSSTGGDYSISAANLITRFSEGWNFLTFATHGNTTIWAVEGGNFSSSHAASLTGPTYIVYTIACLTGAFDAAEPSLSEAFLRNGNILPPVYVRGYIRFVSCLNRLFLFHSTLTSNQSKAFKN